MLTQQQQKELERKLKNLETKLALPIFSAQENISVRLKIEDCIVTFLREDNRLSVTIETEQFFLTTLSPELYPHLYQLYSDPKVMKTFHHGKPKNRAEVDAYIEEWHQAESVGSPFTVFLVFKKDKIDGKIKHTFIGNISPDHRGDDPGIGELTYLILPEYWGEGYGKKLTDTILNYFLPAAVIVGCNLSIRGEPFRAMVGTSRMDNIASDKILAEYLHLIPHSEVERYGAIRRTYFLSLDEMLWRCLQHSIELLFVKRQNDSK